jgi:hypothetical protein
LTELTQILFTVDEDFACTVYQSCKKVSLIAAASIQSSISFMDFLGINGESTSLSVINFQFDPVNQTNYSGPSNATLPAAVQ